MKRLLLVEDEPGLVMTLTDRLVREGYSVDTSADGESGLERAAGEAFDLVLLDVMLPRLNGFDLLRELRRRGVETPVIMLTARGQVVDKVVGLKLTITADQLRDGGAARARRRSFAARSTHFCEAISSTGPRGLRRADDAVREHLGTTREFSPSKL